MGLPLSSMVLTALPLFGYSVFKLKLIIRSFGCVCGRVKNWLFLIGMVLRLLFFNLIQSRTA